MATLWHGRFEGGPGEALQALNDSLPFGDSFTKSNSTPASVIAVCTSCAIKPSRTVSSSSGRSSAGPVTLS